MKFYRVWEMPNSNTFDVLCIARFIEKYNKPDTVSIDPFANSNRIASITNDLDPDMKTDYNMDAMDFLKIFEKDSIDLVLFDPPYSPRQVTECYRKFGRTVNMETTQASFLSYLKIEIARIIKPNGYCLSFGWNSAGIGIKRGFSLEEIMLVAHGGQHNDTICTAERKIIHTLAI